MLKIVVPIGEAYNEELGKFVAERYVELELEHSLASLSKWESKYEKPFLSPDPKSDEETFGYVKAMTFTPDVPDEVFLHLSSDNMNDIQEYIGAKMTATTIVEHQKRAASREIVTAEIIYYWMVSLNIPFECEHWHLNRLITLVRVCNLKNTPPEQMSPSAAAAQQRALNEQRRRELGTRG